MTRSADVEHRKLIDKAAQAMGAADYGTAQRLLRVAAAGIKDDPGIWLKLAAACRAGSDIEGALSAVEKALVINPRSFTALLMKASMLEKQGSRRNIARAYGAAIAVAPPEEALDRFSLDAMRRARKIHDAYREELATFIRDTIKPAADPGRSVINERAKAFIDFAVGSRKAYHQNPTELFYPGLPTIEFYDNAAFPWIETLETALPEISSELIKLTNEAAGNFIPYINYPDSVPLDQWQGLNRSKRWSALHLYEYGKRVDENCSRCPITAGILQVMPQPEMRARSPAAMFSALQPRTRIPPHTGVANTRLVVHLPLVVPKGCGFRVGNQTREWQEGKAWIFDDTIEHEAWNQSDKPRFILIFDIWSPHLSEIERNLITQVVTAMDNFV